MEKIHRGRNLMAGERENVRERNIRCCIYTTTLRKIDRMALNYSVSSPFIRER